MCVGPGQARIVDGLMAWVERRRQLDVEAWLDRLANCWVPVHGWLAWVLLALTLDHVIGACLRGGWWPR
jgi:cytochrome b561